MARRMPTNQDNYGTPIPPESRRLPPIPSVQDPNSWPQFGGGMAPAAWSQDQYGGWQNMAVPGAQMPGAQDPYLDPYNSVWADAGYGVNPASVPNAPNTPMLNALQPNMPPPPPPQVAEPGGGALPGPYPTGQRPPPRRMPVPGANQYGYTGAENRGSPQWMEKHPNGPIAQNTWRPLPPRPLPRIYQVT